MDDDIHIQQSLIDFIDSFQENNKTLECFHNYGYTAWDNDDNLSKVVLQREVVHVYRR